MDRFCGFCGAQAEEGLKYFKETQYPDKFVLMCSTCIVEGGPKIILEKQVIVEISKEEYDMAEALE